LCNIVFHALLIIYYTTSDQDKNNTETQKTKITLKESTQITINPS
jgi:hypothetical protein